MMRLKGYRLTRALGTARLAAWAVTGLLAVLVLLQAAALAFGGGGAQVPEGTADPGLAGPGPAPELPPVEHFALIWETFDPPRPEPEPPAPREPEPKLPPRPPPDPYPEMRLLGTMTEEGRSYALLELGRDRTKLLREGEAWQDIEVISVSERAATVRVPHHTKAFTIEADSELEVGR